MKKVNAFTESYDGGNPAGVVFDSPSLTDEQMKHISKALRVSETAFVFPSKKADYKVRFFSPSVEVDLCGHATVATFFTMALNGFFNDTCRVTQETKAGVLPVHILFFDDVVDRVMMTQSRPIYKNISLDISELADSLKIKKENIDSSLPSQIVSTGLFTLPVCVKSFDVLKHMKPDFVKVKKLCKKIGVGSFHVFTFETIESCSVYHARNFAPIYGINEDPVTGTANGAVCSYLVKNGVIHEKNLVCEQGDIIGKPGRVFVEVGRGFVRVGGKARVVEEKEIRV
ncbi:MAG: PhzF family phenazine biosynthesis protein [Thermoplasmatota archaeon]